ncbi:MAG TPA: glycosyltransferase family 4 protein [Chitinophagaceae bacterium]
MRVAFIARTTLQTIPGGDTVQVQATAKYLRKAGVEVDIKRTTDLIDYDRYDLLHFFNVIRPADILKHIGSGKPYVVSTIFVDYSGYDRSVRRGLPGILFRILPPGQIEYAKVIARFLSGKDAISSTQYLWLGHNRSIKKVLEHASCLLPNSETESHRIEQTYGLNKKYKIVPNGIDDEIFPVTENFEKDPRIVVCAARIEGIKNQLNLIRALNNSCFRLYLIGNPAPNQEGYYRECKRIAADNIEFIHNLPQTALLEFYQHAKVHVLPSWFETTGLSSLEAAAMGCNLVISDKGDVREYFGESAFYCDPGCPSSIRQAVEKAASASVDPSLQQKIRTKFTWEKAAFQTIQAYQAII